MDAEIRRLTYVPRFGGSKPMGATPAGIGSIVGDLPALFRKDEAGKHAAKQADVRAEARLIELERERAESERRHREALDDAHQKAVEERAVALSEQKERLEQGHTSTSQADPHISGGAATIFR